MHRSAVVLGAAVVAGSLVSEQALQALMYGAVSPLIRVHTTQFMPTNSRVAAGRSCCGFPLHCLFLTRQGSRFASKNTE